MRRRSLLRALIGGALAAGGVVALAQKPAKVVKISARKFVFQPNALALKRGEPVVLEFTTEDVHMGFDAPELGLHADIVPDKTVRVPFTPSKAGSFDFACDVFCGSGHDEMGGVIKVLA